jgi:hypothetical protein
MDATKGPARPERRAVAGWLLAPLAAGMAGCSPEHDWREVRAEDGAFIVMLPARPARMTRPINLDGFALEMTMHGAQAREVAYTVGTAVLPDASAATRERALAAMRAAMIRNIGGTERASRAVRVALVDAAGQGTDTVAGLEVEAVGRMRDRDATLVARFVGVGGRIWQAVVLGPAPDREQAALFLGSLKLVRRE